jgi:hypothetical protein
MSGACTISNTGVMSCPLAGTLIPPAADIGAQINATIAANGAGKYVLLPGHYNAAIPFPLRWSAHKPEMSISLAHSERASSSSPSASMGTFVK